jgi:hypothetical protein
MDQTEGFTGNAAELAARAIELGREYGLPVDPDKTNERLVRYYVTEGVVDRPDRVGRDAAYGQRHLLQLLTARRMAQAGMSLAVIAEHNGNALTRALAEGLAKPLPTQAELLVGRFMQGKPAPQGRGPAMPTAAAPAHRPSMALPDVLDEVRSFKDDVIVAMQSLLQESIVTRQLLLELGNTWSHIQDLPKIVAVLADEMPARHEQLLKMQAESQASMHQLVEHRAHAIVEAMEQLQASVYRHLAEHQARQAEDTKYLLQMIDQLARRLDSIAARPPPEPGPKA